MGIFDGSDDARRDDRRKGVCTKGRLQERVVQKLNQIQDDQAI